jgi:hypothetical protein
MKGKVNRKADIKHLNNVLSGISVTVHACADCSLLHGTRVLIEDSEVDKSVMELYGRAVGQLRQVYRELSNAEDMLKHAKKAEGFFGGQRRAVAAGGS